MVTLGGLRADNPHGDRLFTDALDNMIRRSPKLKSRVDPAGMKWSVIALHTVLLTSPPEF